MNFLSFVFIGLIILTTQPITGWAADFSFEKHWSFPLSPQGPPPKKFSKLEASLLPDDCGTCHDIQYEDWQSSRHHKSMGPGITGQFYSPWLDNKTITICGYCHFPLAEQSPFKSLPDGTLTKNTEYSPELQSQGIVCAACHVRRHVRYGPKPLNREKVADPPHNSFVEVENFGDSEFCKPCHQFNQWENRINGKLLQNTYEEWKKSSYPERGIHCSNCHMPDRRHLWQGIHSPEMVKRGIDIQADREDSQVIIKITNSGVGHNFPTYVTPKIIIRGSTLDKKGNELQKSIEEKVIGWDISLDLSEERYDTRIPPGDTFGARFRINSSAEGEKFRLAIRVFPDDFYNRFFKNLLDNPPEGIDLTKIRKAYNDSQQSSYILFEKFWDIK